MSCESSEDNEAIIFPHKEPVHAPIVEAPSKPIIQSDNSQIECVAYYDEGLYNVSKCIGKFKEKILSKWSGKLFEGLRDVRRKSDKMVGDILEDIMSYEKESEECLALKRHAMRCISAYLKKLNPSKYISDIVNKNC
jgi:hypothetical protein